MNASAVINIQDDSPGQGLENPVEAAQDAITAIENAEDVDRVIEQVEGKEWEIRTERSDFFVERLGDEHGGSVRIKRQLSMSFKGAREGIMEMERLEQVLGLAGIETDSYVS